MRHEQSDELWVVYLMAVRRQDVPMNAVCSQSEWDEMELAQPGHHPLVRSGITTEAEAEKLARGTSGDAKAGRYRPRS